jgi:hypothetical protein
MMKLSELSRVITKTIIRTDWVVKRWIIFRMTIKRLYKTISYAFDKKAKMIVYINILNI